MGENDDAAELLFFDTFSHEQDTNINLDLVQFPKPVYITQVRIIPLGARVQADFPGGVRLGATNPSKFGIEFFVNDLGMPGASTFEILGQLEYNQNDCIHLECSQEKIPTDGLVLRGWYTTITLAIYGILPKTVNEPIASPPPPPCETVISELCNLSTDARNAEDATKEEWKEPLPGDIPQHAHKTNANDYDREDMEYGMSTATTSREHYHHSGDERERRLRKASHSSEHSVSSRNRTHSESNDREYIRARNERDKNTRDWSRSPEYNRHGRRKRSEADEPHKWPRTPPASIDSPTRPRSPDTISYMDEDDDEVAGMHYKLKSRSYMRSNESLGNNGATQEAPRTLDDDDDTPGTPVDEQYEPILSDDEIIGDDDSNAAAEQAAADEFEQELQTAALSAAPAIIEFDAFKMPLRKFDCDLHVHHSKDLDNLKLLFKKFELQTKCDSLAVFKDTAVTSVDERENFVYLCEQLINQLAYLTQQFKRRNFVLQQLFQNDVKHQQLACRILQIALDFEAACAQPQPAFKIRHIKIGARLSELLGSASNFLDYLLQQEFNPFEALFKLYQQDYMALSIKLMLLKAIYALLDTKASLRYFLSSKLNGYQMILETLQQSHLTRTNFALQAITKKLNLNEALECIHENCRNIFVLENYKFLALAESYQLIEQSMQQVLDALTSNALTYQQPRRFLPVSKKFEIVTDSQAQRSFANALQAYFVQNALAESLLLMLSNAAELPPSLLLRCLDLLEAALQTYVGVDYFVDDCFETTQLLVAILLGIDEMPEDMDMKESEIVNADAPVVKEEDLKQEKEETSDINDTNSLHSTTTTQEKMEIDNVVSSSSSEERTSATQLLDENKSEVMASTTDEAQPIMKPLLNRIQQLGIELAYKVQTRYHLDAIFYTAASNDYDSIKLATHLHAIYSQTCNSIGLQHTVAVIGLNNNLQVFMDLIKKEQRLQAQRQLSSPGAKYKSPVLSYAVDIVDCCVRYCENLDYLIEHGAHILELAKNHETFEPSVSAVLQEMFVYLKPLEAINIFAYDDITPLVDVITRSLEYITTFPGDLIMGLRILRYLAIGPNCSAFKSADTVELKHRYVALQFYAADGVQILMQVLEKLCSYFEQPGLHAPALMTIQGVHCCQIILPALQILRAMLSFAIQCRDTEFRDLTAIDHLMKTNCLLHYFPATSQATAEVQLAKKEIIKIFLAYTQPHEQDEESLHKSLWTQMIREILKNIDGPATFIPGLQVLTELLPLPLPIPLPISVQLSESHTQRLITERKLWSAHLHPNSAQIAKLIETIAPSSFPQLADLMARVCLQLADLAPNMTLLISKTLTELLSAEWTNASYAPTLHLSRLLHFFAKLSKYASLKSSALSILSGKLWDLFNAILTMTEPNEVGLKCQVAINRILESFIDSNISLISPQSAATSELNLASALPPKEFIARIVEALLTNLINAELTHEVSNLCLRNLVMLTEHDITFHHLSTLLKQKSNDFQQWLQKFIASNEKGAYNESIESLILLLCSLTNIADNDKRNAAIPPRTLKLNAQELSFISGLQMDDKPNVIARLQGLIETNAANCNSSLLGDVQKLITLSTTNESQRTTLDAEDEANIAEPTLPQTESIVTQFAARPIFIIYADGDGQLSTHYWFETLAIDSLYAQDFETQYERIACDLAELASSCLPPETNLTSDCKRVLHLSASPQSNRERTPTAPCFRTRRVEVEPTTGREKKIYITPVRGRGFARPPPSRGDLFRSRPPNTSRPPSLHVDDFLALETCGAQPTGPTGYNKIPPLMRGARVGRNRGSRIAAVAAYRKTKVLRTSSPSTWNDAGYRTATVEPHFGSSDMPHYAPAPHYVGRVRGRGLRARPYLR